MLRLLLLVLGGWMVVSTVLGLLVGRVIGSHQLLEPQTGSDSRERSRHAA
jgi:hypothetical protein